MDEREVDDLVAVLPPLLQALEVLNFVGRRLNPPDLPQLLASAAGHDEPLRAAADRLSEWPPQLADVRTMLQASISATLAAFDGLAAASAGGVGGAYRGLRHLPRALEALYPLSAGLPPVSRFFLDADRRGDSQRVERLAAGAGREGVGVMHVGETAGERGGFSMYVPEDYDPEHPLPLVMALHGGSGDGRRFLWSWLRSARTHGAILVTPTAIGATWALSGPDPDTPNLARILEAVRRRWSVDPQRLLLTGMSDGGTFTYVSGLEPDSPFTHLAPAAAAFHPMLAQMADRGRVQGLPVYITHGALDWMFDVSLAREAAAAMREAGAQVVYREVEDLSHVYAAELNPEILAWLEATPSVA